MSSSKIISVNDTYFQHKVLTKIHGQPVYENLKLLETEIKANASSVPSTIGGGQYGHLGLILSPTRYATLVNTVPWVTPVNPGPFVPPANGTAAQIEAAKDVWRENKNDFAVCQATEKAIVAQIVDAVDKDYIRTLLNRTTGQYSSDIRGVLRHLFTTYGKITPQQVQEFDLATLNMHYDISQPVDNVFDAIEDIVDLAEHGNSPMTAQQMINKAYIIFSKQPVLKQDLRDWNRKPLIDRTWANMVTHFRDAQSELRALPVAADIYNQQHQANTVAVMADLVAQRLLEAMPNLPYEEAPVQAPAIAPVIAPLPDTVNAAIQQREASLAAREAALETRMQEMTTLLIANTGTGGQPNTGGNWQQATGNRRGRGGRGGVRTNNHHNNPHNPPGVRGPRQYCWTHGCCAHDGHGCDKRAPGHKVEATFANMMGGSTKNCYWLTQT